MSTPEAKRPKTDVVLKDVLSPDILDKEAELKKEVESSKPYPHGIIKNIFDPEFMKKLLEEVKDNSKVDFKESDLFRVFQSIDMANLDQNENKDKLPTVMQLRNVLYSEEWRSFMEGVLGLEKGTLKEQVVDCAFNCHAPGCHLLCHDDVIGTRKISYILYLTEEGWSAEEGGALELYDSLVPEGGKVRVPETTPCKTIVPEFNSMAFFEVQPGYSFHAVQEVLGDRPRLSLQGWYHAAEPPKDIENATLNRLKSAAAGNNEGGIRDAEDTEGEFQTMDYQESKKEELSDEDIEYLSKYLNPAYLKPEGLTEIREKFEKESSIQLRGFFKEEWAKKLETFTQAEDEELVKAVPKDPTDLEYYKVGVSDCWKMVGPAHKQRFLEYSGSDDAVTDIENMKTTGQALQHLKEIVMQSPQFGRFMNQITSLGLPEGHRGHIRRFRRGLDYTVAHFGLLSETPVLDATLCFVAGKGDEILDPKVTEDEDGEATEGDEKPKGVKFEPQKTAKGEDPDEADLMWQSGDCGGFECYIAAEDDDEAADEYNEDDDTELLSVHASTNTLSLVYRDPGTMRFIKYVSAKAPSSRWDIAMEYKVPVDEEETAEKEE